MRNAEVPTDVQAQDFDNWTAAAAEIQVEARLRSLGAVAVLVCLAPVGQIHCQVAALLPAVQLHARGPQHVHALQSVAAVARQGAKRKGRCKGRQAWPEKLRLLGRLPRSRDAAGTGRMDLDLQLVGQSSCRLKKKKKNICGPAHHKIWLGPK